MKYIFKENSSSVPRTLGNQGPLINTYMLSLIIALLICVCDFTHTCTQTSQPTFLDPGGAGSKILVCISEGRAEYTGRIIRSGTSGPRAFIRSYKISHAESISSWPVRNSSTSPIVTERFFATALFSFFINSHFFSYLTGITKFLFLNVIYQIFVSPTVI